MSEWIPPTGPQQEPDKTDSAPKTPPSPCVGFCSTTFGDPVCRGCKRRSAEVDQWNHLSRAQQKVVWERLWQQAEQLIPDWLVIEDTQKLRHQLQRLQIRHHPEAPASAWVLDLLRVGHPHIRDLTAYGLRVQVQHQALSLPDLWQQINQAWYQHALAAPATAR